MKYVQRKAIVMQIQSQIRVGLAIFQCIIELLYVKCSFVR